VASVEDNEKLVEEFHAWLAKHRSEHWATFARHLGVAERSSNSRAWEAELGASGWLGISWPADYGGRGLSQSAELRIVQELQAAGAPELFNVTGLELVGPALLRFGTDAQKQMFLPALLAGQIWCQGFSEPEAGSDLANLRTTARLDGDSFVINGQKVWSTNSPVAEYCILLARTDPEASLHRGITCFLVPMKLPGIEVRPIQQITGDADFSEIFFTDVLVTADAVLGDVNGGWRVATHLLTGERAMMFSLLSTVHNDLQNAIEAVRKNAATAFDNSLVSRAAQVAADELVVQWCNESIVEHVAAGQADERLEATMKVSWSELHQRIVQLAIDAYGIDGLLEAGDSQAPDGGHWLWALLHGRAETIYAGTSEIQRNIIGERILGLPREPRGATFGTGEEGR
jgi:alkylation response protein AidB-like acyl-CoA dehydrogenase